MSLVSRNARALKPDAVVTIEEKETIRKLCAEKKVSLGNNANDYIRAIARLGGFLARRSDGDPGPLVLWRGYLRLQDITLGMSLIPP
jgi:hypothetical protein